MNNFWINQIFEKCIHISIVVQWLWLEMFYLNSTLNYEIPLVLVFQLEVYNKVVRLLTGLTAQQKGTTTRWYSNKTFLIHYELSEYQIFFFGFSECFWVI